MANILVVDDVAEIRTLLRDFLTIKKHTVYIAENGIAALKIAEKEEVDIIITDMVMPEYDGVETLLAFKEKHPHVKMIAMSGGNLNSATYLSLAEKIGALKTLTKPIDFDDLISFIDSIS